MIYYLIIINALSFLFYGIDKIKAKRGSFRISEKHLFILSFLGGFIGSIIGMKVFHHKTKKWYFWGINIFFMLIWTFFLLRLYHY